MAEGIGWRLVVRCRIAVYFATRLVLVIWIGRNSELEKQGFVLMGLWLP